MATIKHTKTLVGNTGIVDRPDWDADHTVTGTVGNLLAIGAGGVITDVAPPAGTTDPEIVRDTIATALVSGVGIAITPNDAGDTITIAATGGGGTITGLASAANRATLAGLATTTPAVYLSELRYEGVFVFDPANYHDGRSAIAALTGSTLTDEGNKIYLSKRNAGGGIVANYAPMINAATAFQGEFTIFFQRAETVAMNFIIGLDASAATTIDYPTMDWGVEFAGSTLFKRLNGAFDGAVNAASGTSWFAIKRTAANALEVYECAAFAAGATPTLTGATLRTTFTGTASGPLYLKLAGYEDTVKVRLLAIDTPNLGNSLVQADVAQALYVPISSDTSGKSGVWRRTLDAQGAMRIEWFGALGDGVTNDTVAFGRAGKLISYIGHGYLTFRPRATYIVGVQTHTDGDTNYYRDADILRLTGFDGLVRIQLNGCTIKSASGLRIGGFNATTGAAETVASTNLATYTTPYKGMIYAHDYSGRLEVEGGTLDGNCTGHIKGGVWGDTGFQVQNNGLLILPGLGKGTISVEGVIANNHGADGGTYQSLIENKRLERVMARFIGCDFNFNGRNGFSLTGGRGIHFENCAFNHTGRLNIQSLPQFGFDMEPDGGTWARDVSFVNCEFLDGAAGGYGGASGRMQEIAFYRCRFDDGDGQAIFVQKPGHIFTDCRVSGSFTSNAWTDNFNNISAGTPIEEGHGSRFVRCIFTNNPVERQAGVKTYPLGTAGTLDGSVRMDDCTWDYAHTSGLTPATGAGVLHHNTILYSNISGTLNFMGTFKGRTVFNSPSAGSYVEDTPEKIHGEFIKNNVRQFEGSKTHDWLSIAPNASASTAVTVPGAKFIDARNYVAKMTINTGGLILSASVTATDTVTVTAFNPTGAAIDLVSGTLSVVGVR